MGESSEPNGEAFTDYLDQILSDDTFTTTVLLASSSEEDLQVLREALREPEFRIVAEVHHSEQLLETVQTHVAEIVIMHTQLLGGDVLQLARQIHFEVRQSAVVLLMEESEPGGESMRAFLMRAHRAGVRQPIIKPLHTPTLYETLRQTRYQHDIWLNDKPFST